MSHHRNSSLILNPETDIIFSNRKPLSEMLDHSRTIKPSSLILDLNSKKVKGPNLRNKLRRTPKKFLDKIEDFDQCLYSKEKNSEETEVYSSKQKNRKKISKKLKKRKIKKKSLKNFIIEKKRDSLKKPLYGEKDTIGLCSLANRLNSSASVNSKINQTLGVIPKSFLGGKSHKEFKKIGSILKKSGFLKESEKLGKTQNFIRSSKKVTFSKKVFVFRFRTQDIEVDKQGNNDTFLKNIRGRKSSKG